MKVLFVRNYGIFWLRSSIRAASLLMALILLNFLKDSYFLYSYFAASITLDVIVYKILKLKESSFKKEGYFEKKFNSPGKLYDEYTNKLVNLKLIAFTLAHTLFFMPLGFENTFSLVALGFSMFLLIAVIALGVKYGYHEVKEVGEKESNAYGSKHEMRSSNGRGPGYLNGVWTGDLSNTSM